MYETLAEAEVTESFIVIKDAIGMIYADSTTLSFNQVYNRCYQLRWDNMGEKLYYFVRDCLVEQLNLLCQASITNVTGPLLSTNLIRIWEHHQTAMGKLSGAMMPLDDLFAETANLPRLRSMTWELFIRVVFVDDVLIALNRLMTDIFYVFRQTNGESPQDSDIIKEHSENIKIILNVLKQEGHGVSIRPMTGHGRDVHVVNRDNLPVFSVEAGGPECLDQTSLPSVDLLAPYETLFERNFLDQTEGYYRKEFPKHSAEGLAPYLAHVSRIYTREMELLAYFEIPSLTQYRTHELLGKILVAEYIPHLRSIKATTIAPLFASSSFGHQDVLTNLYHCFVVIYPPGLSEILQIFTSVCLSEFEMFMNQKILPEETLSGIDFCKLLYHLFTEFQRVLLPFEREKKFEQALHDCLNFHISEFSCEISERLSKFLDHLIRTNQPLDPAILIFSLITEKDQFASCIRYQIQSNVYQSLPVDIPHVQQIVKVLHKHSGMSLVRDLVFMLKNLGERAELIAKFRSSPFMQNATCLEIAPLADTVWPLVTFPVEVPLHPCLLSAFDEYKSWYEKEHKRRRLVVQSSLGNVVLSIQTDRKYFITVPLSLASILLHFNDFSSIDSRDLAYKTGVNLVKLEKILAFLSNPGDQHSNLLIYSAEAANASDPVTRWRISINPQFHSQNEKLAYQPPKSLGINLESTHFHRTSRQTKTILDSGNTQLIEATIVRIMKAFRKLSVDELIQKVEESISFFRVAPEAVKRELDSMLEKEYIKQEGSCYSYVS